MERFALSRMKEWKENENRKPLIIRGARQVGKTWIMKTFGQQYFEKTAYVNFDNNARMKQVFEGDLDIERLVLSISAETGVSIEAENTLIIFDDSDNSNNHYERMQKDNVEWKMLTPNVRHSPIFSEKHPARRHALYQNHRYTFPRKDTTSRNMYRKEQTKLFHPDVSTP